MKEISLNILDIAENSVKARATLTKITVNETDGTLTLKISDNGCGMTAETLKAVTDPFYTTRTTRKVGMGLPLLKMEAEASVSAPIPVRTFCTNLSPFPPDIPRA